MISDFIQMLLAVVVITLLVMLEYKKSGVFYTPFILMACPYAIIFFIQWYSIQLYDLSSFNSLYFLYMILHLFLVWVMDMLTLPHLNIHSLSIVPIRNDKVEKNSVDIQNARACKLIGTFGILFSVYLILNFLIGANSLSAIGQVVQEEYQESYSGGFNFYARLICMISSVYFFSFFDKKNKRYFFYGILCLVPNILTFVKGTIFICIVAAVVGNTIIHHRKIRLKTLLAVALAGVIVFFGVYLIEICIWNPYKFFQKETYEYIFAKLNFYLISGVQGFNERLNSQSTFINSGQDPVFAPIINAFAKTGLIERTDPISHEWTTLGTITNYGVVSTNTYSSIGVLVLYLGFFPSLVLEMIIALIGDGLFLLMYHKRKLEYFLLYTIFSASFILGWFNYYLVHTFWIYIFIILVFIAIITRRIKIKFPKIKLSVKLLK